MEHQSSHPLDNLISPLDSGIQTTSNKKKSSCIFSVISTIEPKNIKEDLQDADWVTSKHEELQYERSKIWHLVPCLSTEPLL